MRYTSRNGQKTVVFAIAINFTWNISDKKWNPETAFKIYRRTNHDALSVAQEYDGQDQQPLQRIKQDQKLQKSSVKQVIQNDEESRQDVQNYRADDDNNWLLEQEVWLNEEPQPCKELTSAPAQPIVQYKILEEHQEKSRLLSSGSTQPVIKKGSDTNSVYYYNRQKMPLLSKN